MDTISFEGLDPAVVLHALYHGTGPLGLGILHDQPRLSVEDARADIAAREEQQGRKLYFDYYHGRPLKMTFDLDGKTFTTRLYDRDAGKGAAERVIAALRAKAA